MPSPTYHCQAECRMGFAGRIRIDFSEAGIRKHLRRMLDEGWCSLEGCPHDRRLRRVVAQPKMLAALADYVRVLREAFGVGRTGHS